MKSFFKTVLAVICGILLLNLVLIVLATAFFGAASAAGKAGTALPKEGVLYVDMSKFSLAEQASESDPISMIQGGSTVSVGIWDAIQAINIAAGDPGVKYIYLRPEGASAGNAEIQEFRGALDNFRKSGKAIVSKFDAGTTGSIYLSSVADKVYMTSYEGGTSTFLGIGTSLIYLKDILDKLGVNVQLIRHGKYKSAGEMFITNTPSEANIEQNQAMVSSIWNSLAGDIAKSRGISLEALNTMVDNLDLVFPEDFKNAGLVDELISTEDFKGKLTTLAMVDEYDDIKFIQFPDYVKSKVKMNFKAKKKLAVIYADGEIVDGTQKKEVAGQYFAKVISDVRADSTVNAVVFRVNSPGGSVLASEQIKAEIDLLAKEKPVVASYGDYAASGGYWISNNCEKIFANPATLTGSIGVFSMIPEFSGTLKDIAHVNVFSINSNKHADMLSLSRPFDADETAALQASVERIYDKFVSIVADGRGLEPAFVDSIAQGRVWTGADALGIGLVDEIGTIEDAIKYTIGLVEPGSELKDWNIQGYPKPLTSMEQIKEMFGSSAKARANVFEGTALEGIGEAAMSWVDSWKNSPSTYMFARMPYMIEIQ